MRCKIECLVDRLGPIDELATQKTAQLGMPVVPLDSA